MTSVFPRVRLALMAVLAAPLWLGANDCLEDHEPSDAGDGDATPDGGAAACATSDCAGQPIPEIGCVDGQPIVLCERQSDGSCHVRVDCPGQPCAGLVGASCPGGQFCNLEVAAGGDGCDVADGQGVCEAVPANCSSEFAPVCGCDRRGYSNACVAHTAGVSVLHDDYCTYDECESIGGRVVTSSGADVPACEPGEDSYALAGIEGALCCLPESGGGLSWYRGCGDPVCSGHRPGDLPPCQSETAGQACSNEGAQCDLQDDCNTHLVCASSDPTLGQGGCPISRAAAKTDIHYLSDAELARYHDQVLGLGLAHYRYTADPQQEERLGFIIEDVEPSSFVEEARNRVDLYAYTSAVIAALKVQDQRIRELESELRALRRERRRHSGR
jgi:hypothetical protein